ncbi:MAG: SDR family oxidoreductase [Candidatus Eiseniibacteriota bacterium]|jgi:nucleoside-diphosphate-sugar epimerase
MQRYLVTGGAGFIGSHLVERLLADGQGVRVIDNFENGTRENLEAARAAATARRGGAAAGPAVIGDLEVVEADIRDSGAVERTMQGIEVVYHEAALASVQRSIQSPALVNTVNVGGTLNLLEAARQAGVRRFVFAGSSSVYGDSEELPKREDHRPQPISPYGVTKLVAEEYLRVYHHVYGLETVSLRYFNVFGARQAADSEYSAVIPIFLRRLFRGERPIIYGDGQQSRDFTYIDNVVEANMLAATAPAELVAGQVMNAATGGNVTVKELCAQLIALCGTGLEPVHAAPRPGDILHSHADITRATQLLGYRPQVDFATGLRRTFEWYAERLRPGKTRGARTAERRSA